MNSNCSYCSCRRLSQLSVLSVNSDSGILHLFNYNQYYPYNYSIIYVLHGARVSRIFAIDGMCICKWYRWCRVINFCQFLLYCQMMCILYICASMMLSIHQARNCYVLYHNCQMFFYFYAYCQPIVHVCCCLLHIQSYYNKYRLHVLYYVACMHHCINVIEFLCI